MFFVLFSHKSFASDWYDVILSGGDFDTDTRLTELDSLEKKYLEEFEAMKGEYTELDGDVATEELSEIHKTGEKRSIEKIRSAYRDRADFSLVERCGGGRQSAWKCCYTFVPL